jgi:tetratricopeptide (TPR) repeat protein
MSMPDPTSVQSILDAAEQAAAVGDIGTAGQLLRRAVALQETQLGPHHPDLANTLNNLGVVCEKTGRLDDAEGCYRRAYEIAAAALEPDHPFVITSRKNLADFREARGTAVEPPPASAALPPASAVVPAASPPQRPAPAKIEQDTGKDAGPAAKQAGFRRARSGPLVIVLAALVVLVLGVLAIRRTSGPVEPSSPDSSDRLFPDFG